MNRSPRSHKPIRFSHQPPYTLAAEETQLLSLIAELRSQYARMEKPYVDRLNEIYLLKPAPPIVIACEQFMADQIARFKEMGVMK